MGNPLHRRRLKYKNIVLAAAGMLLLIVILIAACSAGDKTEPKKTTESSVPDSSSVTESSSKVEKTIEKLPKNDYQYLSIENKDQLNTGDLLLINSEHPYTGSKPKELKAIYEDIEDDNGKYLFSMSSTEIELTTVMANAVRNMLKDFETETGLTTIMIVDGYQTEEDSGSSGSENLTGMAVDFQLDLGDEYPAFDGKGEYTWIMENCSDYGLIARYPEEKKEITKQDADPGHFRYVGIPHAQIMVDQNWCLEEYIENIKAYTYEDALYVSAENGTDYAVYYIKSEDGATTNIKYPVYDDGSPYAYTVSGNNVDGYIITVDLTNKPEETSDDNSDNATDAS